MTRILCIRLPIWPIQRLRAECWKQQPGSSPTAIILHARDPRRGNRVVACSQEAFAVGVRLGMPLAEAVTLASPFLARCEDEFAVFAHDPAADLAALALLAKKCERFSPLVGWQTVDASKTRGLDQEEVRAWWSEPGPGHLFLDITGIGRLFGGEKELVAAVGEDFCRQGYETSIAIAETIGAAWASASATGDLALLPVSSLRLPAETLGLLSQLGITRIEELLRLPRESLMARFGPQLLLRIDQALGAAQEIIIPHRPLPRFQAEWILDFPTDSRELIDQILAQLLERVTQGLAQRQEGVVQLACRFDGDGGIPLQLTVGLFRPSAAAKHLHDLVRMQLEQTILPRQIGRIGIQAVLTAPLENRQGELFAGSSPGQSREFALLVDRLSSRLGPAAVLRPVLRSDPLPERAVCYRMVVDKMCGSKSRKSKSRRSPAVDADPGVPGRSPLIRPLILHQPPLPLHAISIMPGGLLISFEWKGRVHRVSRHWGPERIETGWWRGRSLRRDYYRVETTAGLRFWLFRRIEDGQWHLHGEF
jgi:protein ImuB